MVGVRAAGRAPGGGERPDRSLKAVRADRDGHRHGDEYGDGVELDAQSPNGAQRVRQYYVVRAGEDQSRQALILTLTAPAALMATMLPTFATIVARLLPEGTPPPTPAPRS